MRQRRKQFRFDAFCVGRYRIPHSVFKGDDAMLRVWQFGLCRSI